MANGNTPEKPQQSDDTASKAHAPVNTEAQKSLDERLRKLEGHLAAKGVGEKSENNGKTENAPASMGQAMKLSSEFIAGIIMGAGLGWFVDRVAGTNPWGLIIFLFLGFGAGTLNVLRSAGYVAENGSNVDKKQQK
ncbi:AtpZ/AtpI family protein [Pseudochrobactrum sp. MP213Fo]|uniref:AtpZ/AtpI family protein n=1 Tax=Pseudochrobactrum sp. MP213Fo TaxID=3022250 RepID=UPI003BA232A0